MTKKLKVPVLGNGYVQLVEHWGSDESVIEAARMSTGKGFNGWGTPEQPGDEKLLGYLYKHKHHTPFEMAGFIIEVKAPIFVFREWHRHRTQSFNEMSARYIPLPDEDYVPTIERLMSGANTKTVNKQAQGSGELTHNDAVAWRNSLIAVNEQAESIYKAGIAAGVPKELARLSVPVSRYSRMRASANLRNWLGFLSLRGDASAQWEIQEYARAVDKLVEEHFPQTWKLFKGN